MLNKVSIKNDGQTYPLTGVKWMFDGSKKTPRIGHRSGCSMAFRSTVPKLFKASVPVAGAYKKPGVAPNLTKWWSKYEPVNGEVSACECASLSFHELAAACFGTFCLIVVPTSIVSHRDRPPRASVSNRLSNVRSLSKMQCLPLVRTSWTLPLECLCHVIKSVLRLDAV